MWLRLKVIQREDDGRVCVGEKRERERQRATILAVSRKKPHKSLAVCWLDLANAQGSVHHALTHFSFQHYHAPHSSVKPSLNLRDKGTRDEWKLESVFTACGDLQNSHHTTDQSSVPNIRFHLPDLIFIM